VRRQPTKTFAYRKVSGISLCLLHLPSLGLVHVFNGALLVLGKLAPLPLLMDTLTKVVNLCFIHSAVLVLKRAIAVLKHLLLAPGRHGSVRVVVGSKIQTQNER
jgi:hypothetical protein